MSGIAAFGIQLKLGRGNTVPGPETFDLIGGVADLGGPGFSVDTIDVTAHDSPGAIEEIIASIIRTGEVSITLNYDPNAQTHSGNPTPPVSAGLLALLMARTKRNYQLVFPSSPAITLILPCLVTGFEPGAPVDDKLSADVTLKVAGAPTLA